jgi:hypothetical protein
MHSLDGAIQRQHTQKEIISTERISPQWNYELRITIIKPADGEKWGQPFITINDL